MNKFTSYVLATIACFIYWGLFIIILTKTGQRFEDLGFFWKALFLASPLVGIWSIITGLAKKAENKKDEKDNDTV
jgi:hypothetical protein